MLNVINQKFLVLHLVLESQPQDCPNRFRVVVIGKLLDEACHLFIDVGTIQPRLGDCRTRPRAALGPLNARPEAFVIRIEVEKEFVGIDFVARLILLQYCLKKP